MYMDMSSQAENEQSLQIWSLRATKDDSELTYYKKMQTHWTHLEINTYMVLRRNIFNFLEVWLFCEKATVMKNTAILQKFIMLVISTLKNLLYHNFCLSFSSLWNIYSYCWLSSTLTNFTLFEKSSWIIWFI